jgi:glutathione S-transferase
VPQLAADGAQGSLSLPRHGEKDSQKEGLKYFDSVPSKQPYAAGSTFSMADITLLAVKANEVSRASTSAQRR